MDRPVLGWWTVKVDEVDHLRTWIHKFSRSFTSIAGLNVHGAADPPPLHLLEFSSSRIHNLLIHIRMTRFKQFSNSALHVAFSALFLHSKTMTDSFCARLLCVPYLPHFHPLSTSVFLHEQQERKGLEVEENSETQRPELKNLHIHWLW